MNSDLIEERLRGALAKQAETFSASPDAWQHVEEKAAGRARPRSRRRGGGWLAGHSSFVIPATAAAAVIAVALGATALSRGLSSGGGHAATPPGSATQSPVVQGSPSDLLPSEIADSDPPISAIFGLKITSDITTWNWIGRPSPLYWFPYIATSPQACHLVDQPKVGGSDYCWPVPTLNAAHPAVVISNSDFPGSAAKPVLSGLAEPAVTSVTAVLRNGQHVPVAIGTGRGFGFKAWSVRCPAAGTTLVFTGAAGQVIAHLGTAAPRGPIVLDLPRPKRGGIEMFSYPAGLQGNYDPAGSVTAYLVDGHVAFFTSRTFGPNGSFSPWSASAAPPVDGMVLPFGERIDPNDRFTLVKAFGYAHGNVARVVVRLPGGGQVHTATFQAGWPGSDLRLWQVSLPLSAWNAGRAEPTFIATAYGALGQVLGQTQLGGPQR